MFEFVFSGAGTKVPGMEFADVTACVAAGASKRMMALDGHVVYEWVSGVPIFPQLLQAWFQGVHLVAWKP